MKRKALIIGANPKNAPLPGVPRDMSNWKEFLTANEGGAWEDDEIILLNNPTRDNTLWAVAAIANADYAVTVFLGHGYVKNDMMDIPETFLILDNDEEISERELNPGAPKYLSITDCCRKYEEIDEAINFSKSASDKSSVNRQQARVAFDQAASRAEGGWVKLYAADLNQSANDEASFSHILIKEVTKWATSNSGVLDVKSANALVQSRFGQINPQQTPILNAGRRLRHFPIAVGSQDSSLLKDLITIK